MTEARKVGFIWTGLCSLLAIYPVYQDDVSFFLILMAAGFALVASHTALDE